MSFHVQDTSRRKGLGTKTNPKNSSWWKIRSWRSLCLDTWTFEISATIFSIACFIAICGLLINYDQSARPKLHYGLSLNAIISVLGTGCKSSLIFVIGEAIGQLKWAWFNTPRKLYDIQALDSASRGPLGSMALFRTSKGSLPSLGAVVIILFLSFDPFIQQIIGYPTRLAAVNGDLSPPTTKKLDYFASTVVTDYSSGFWSEDNTLNPSCPSGNCKWPKFLSSGMCSQCADITTSTGLKCEITADRSDPSRWHLPENTDPYINATCHLSPPQGDSTKFHLQFSYATASIHRAMTYEARTVSWHIFSAYSDNPLFKRYPQDESQPFNWPGDPLLVVGYAEIGYDEDYLSPSLNSTLLDGIRVEKATQCSLELCLLEYELSVENGTLESNTSILDYGRLFWRNSHGPSINLNQTLCWKPTSSPLNITIDEDFIDSTAIQLSPVEFAFCGISYQIALPRESVFEGSTLQVRYIFDHYTEPWGRGLNMDLPGGNDPNTLRIGAVGLENIMSNIAKHMNKETLRLNGSDVNGTAYVTEVFVEVQWPWLVFPMVLVVSGIIFITTAILKHRKTSLWKSSVLAFLYHGLHDVDNSESMAASDMERKAEGLVVQLQASENHGGLILQEKRSLV